MHPCACLQAELQRAVHRFRGNKQDNNVHGQNSRYSPHTSGCNLCGSFGRCAALGDALPVAAEQQKQSQRQRSVQTNSMLILACHGEMKKHQRPDSAKPCTSGMEVQVLRLSERLCLDLGRGPCRPMHLEFQTRGLISDSASHHQTRTFEDSKG